MLLPDSYLISLILNSVAIERNDLVPDPQSRSLRRSSGPDAGHDVGALRWLIRKIEAEFDRRGLVEPDSGHPEVGIEHGGCRENDRQHERCSMNPSRSLAA